MMLLSARKKLLFDNIFNFVEYFLQTLRIFANDLKFINNGKYFKKL